MLMCIKQILCSVFT